VHRLRQVAAAEAYSDRVYRARQQQLREQRHAELAAALRRQRQGSGAAGPPSSAAAAAAPLHASSGSLAGNGGALHGLQIGTAPRPGSAADLAAGGAAANKRQSGLGSNRSSEEGADIYLLLVQASFQRGG
jgi:hypothetical protein